MGFFDKLSGRPIRDPIKNKAYFRKYIQQQEKRIDRFSNMIKQGQVPKERICLVETFVAELKSSVLTAKYSMGAELNDLSKEWPEVLCTMAKHWDTTIGQADLINTVALSVLYEVDDATWDTVSKAACQYGRKDWLVGFLLSSREGGPDYQEWEVLMKNPYQTLRNILETSSKKAEDIKEYLEKEWYKGHDFLPWYDIHKSDQMLYCGYWSNEAAAAVKILGIDDSCLKDQQYYPYDLAHFKKEL